MNNLDSTFRIIMMARKVEDKLIAEKLSVLKHILEQNSTSGEVIIAMQNMDTCFYKELEIVRELEKAIKNGLLLSEVLRDYKNHLKLLNEMIALVPSYAHLI